MKKQLFISIFTLCSLLGSFTLPVVAEASDTRTLKSKIKSAWKRPAVKGGATGAAVGTGVGLITGHPIKGAIVGTGAGAAVGGIHHSKALRNKPVVRSGAQGAVVGAGVGAIAGKSIFTGGLVGAGAGLGAHYVKKHVLNKGTCKTKYDRNGRQYQICD